MNYWRNVRAGIAIMVAVLVGAYVAPVFASTAPTVTSIAGADFKINASEKSAIIVSGVANDGDAVSVVLTDSAGSPHTASSTVIAALGAYTATLDGSAFIDGAVTSFVTANDGASGPQVAVVQPTATLDSVAPTLSNPSTISTPRSSTSVAFSFDSDESGSISYAGTCGAGDLLNTGANPNTTNYTVAAGTHSNCTVTVTDAFGNPSSPLALPTFVVDTTAPTLVSAKVTAADQVTVVFSEPVNAVTGDFSDFKGALSGNSFSLTGSGTNTIILTRDPGPGSFAPDAVGTMDIAATVTDLALNPLATLDDQAVTDSQNPTLSFVSIRSNNANSPNLAKVGDEVTLFATSTEALAATPVVTIATQAAVVTQVSPTEFKAVFTMTSSEATGLIPFTANFTDLAANAGTQVTAVTNGSSVTFDKTAPTVAITQPFTDSFVKGSSVVVFTDSEPTAAQCSVGAGFVACTSGSTTLGDLTGFAALGETTFTLTVQDTDPAGNTGSVTRSLVKDTVAPTAPAVPTVVAGNALINSAENTAGFVINATVGTSGAAVGDTLELLLNGTSFPTPLIATLNGTDLASGHGFTVAFGQLGADGTKLITARVTDQAGNLGPQSGQLALLLDTVAPTAAVTYSTSTPVRLGQTVTITATFSEAMDAGASVDMALFGANTLAATAMTRSSATVYTFDHVVGAGDGAATVALSNGTDVAGNFLVGVPTSGVTFTVDNTIPTITPVTIASSNAVTTLARLGDTITLTFTTNDTNTVRTPVVTIGGQAATVSGGPTAWTASRAVNGSDTSGAVTFSVDVSDQAGNAATTGTATTNASAVTIDLVAPVLLEVTPVTTPANDVTPDYTFSATEAGTISYGGDCSSGTSAAVVGSNTLTFNTLGEGIHSNCTITVTDTVGNASTPLAVTAFTVDTTAPAVTSVTSTTVDGAYKAGVGINLTVNFSEAVSSAVGLTLTTNAGGGATCSTGAISNAVSASCTYTVAAGQNSADLDVTSITGTITDAATNATSNPVAATTLASARAIAIDTTEPTVVSVATSKPDGFYPLGTVIDFTVTMSEPVVVTGFPQIALNTTNGGFAIFNSGSGTNTLTLRYTVGVNQNSADLDYNATNSFGSAGDIADLASNNNGGANPTLPALPNIAATHALVIDTIAPTATPLPVAPAGPFINAAENTAGFQVFASTTGSGAVAGDTLELLLGGAAFPAPLTHVLTAGEATNGFIFTVSAGQLGADGAKSITSRVIDQATNIGTQSAALSLTLDTVAPVAPVLASIAGDNRINNAEKAAIVVLGTAEANALVDISLTDTAGSTKVASQQLSGGSTAYSFTIDGTTATPAAFIDGVITPNVTATDAAGNVSATTVLSTVLQDTIAPAAPVVSLSNPVNLASVASSAVTGTGEGNTTIAISITDGTLSVPATGTTTAGGVVSVGAIDLSSLSEGTLTASVTLTDAAGNVSIAGTATATKDTIIPVFSAVTPADNAFINNVTTGSLISYTLSEALSSGTTTLTRTGGAADGTTHTCVLTGNAKTAGSHVLDLSDTANSCVSAETLVDGAIYSIAFVGTDVNFNTSVTTTRTNVTFDITDPVLTVTSPLPLASTATSLVLRVGTSEAATCSATLDGVATVMTSTGGTTHTTSLTDLSLGAHTVGFSCADPATNVGTSPTESFTVLATSGSTLTATTTNVVLNSVTQGDAALPPGIANFNFVDTNLLDLSAKTSTVSGGTVVINGVTQDLANITTGILVGENLSTPRTIGTHTFTIGKAVHITSGIPGVPMTLVNQTTRNSGITVSIPDDTTIFAPVAWDGTLKPARTPLITTGSAPEGLIASGEITFGADTSLIFSRPVTITLNNFTPKAAAFKTAGSDVWVAMGTCTGTFESPTVPAFATECFIRDSATATKIVTFHLTSFGDLIPDPKGANGPITSGGGGGGGGGGIFIPASNVSATTPGTAASIGAAVSGGSQGTVLGAKAFRFLKNLSFGMTNTDVTELQKVLIAEGLLKTKATGYFGPATKAAVTAYQKKYKISPQTGAVGPLTRGRLNLAAASLVSTATSTPIR